MKIITEPNATLKHVQGHKVKHWNRNNSAADCSIAFKFGTEFHHVTDDMLQMFKVKGQRSRSRDQKSRSRRIVMYQPQKRYNTAMDRFSDFKLGMALYLKRKRTGVASPGKSSSSCNAFAIATFSSWRFSTFSPCNFRGRGTFINGYEGCVHQTSLDFARTSGDNRCVALLFQSLDTLLHFQTRAAQSWVMLYTTPNFALYTPLCVN